MVAHHERTLTKLAAPRLGPAVAKRGQELASEIFPNRCDDPALLLFPGANILENRTAHGILLRHCRGPAQPVAMRIL